MRQSASNILMVRPASFQFNVQTALSNDFQNQMSDMSEIEVLTLAQREFDTMVSELTANKIQVNTIDDTPLPVKPDAIFPNNWISMSENGVITLFPMKTENRRLERRLDIVDWLKNNYEVTKVIDLSSFEDENLALEGTGSIVFDHLHKKAYACISPRTDVSILHQHCEHIGYQPVVFHSYDRNGKLIYHTNVVMCVGTGYVVIGLDSVKDEKERKNLLQGFESDNLEVINLSESQLLDHFAGNMLQVENMDGELFLVMSKRAFDSLSEMQKISIERYAQILPVSIDIIETIGGGSARCMMAEIFLNKK